MGASLFKPFSKIPRLNRDIVLTEKIDGTCSAVGVVRVDDDADLPDEILASMWVDTSDIPAGVYGVYAQSRNRVLTLEKDNFEFARWVKRNAGGLMTTLGEGIHFGEWWGHKVNYNYNLPKGERRFSLFNTGRWNEGNVGSIPGLSVVPVLYEGPFRTDVIDIYVDKLRNEGSVAAPGAKAEGLIVYHTAANSMFKVLCENDSIPKGLT